MATVSKFSSYDEFSRQHSPVRSPYERIHYMTETHFATDLDGSWIALKKSSIIAPITEALNPKTQILFERVPDENRRFANVIYTEAIDNDRTKSLLKMRESILARKYEGAVFIGGMEGILEEYELFHSLHPKAKSIAVGSPGGASKILAEKLGQDTSRIDFARLYYDGLEIDAAEPRDKVRD